MGAQLARLQAAMEGQVQTSVHMEVGQNGDRTDSSERGVNLPWFVE